VAPDLRLAAVGAVVLAGRATGRAVGAAVGLCRAVAGPVGPLARHAVPPAARRTVGSTLERLDREGRRAAATGTDLAGRRAGALARDVARSRAVSRTIDEVVDQVVWPVVDRVLPGLLERLAQEPEPVRAIVQGQSQRLVDDLLLTTRRRAASGDEAADRLLERLFRRPRRAPAAVDAATDGAGLDDTSDPVIDALLGGPAAGARP
jgi:hypothetical protein